MSVDPSPTPTQSSQSSRPGGNIQFGAGTSGKGGTGGFGGGALVINVGGTDLTMQGPVPVRGSTISVDDFLAEYGTDNLVLHGNMAQAIANEKLAKAAGYPSFEDAIRAAASDPERATRTWREFLVAQAQAWKDAGVDFLQEGGGGGGGGGPFSYSDTTISLSSLSEAGAIADQVYQSELGRRASDEEIRAFHKALNAAQKRNPSTSTTTGVASGSSRTSTTQSRSGFNPERFAVEYAQSNPEYAETFAATTFMQVLDKAIAQPNALDELIGGE